MYFKIDGPPCSLQLTGGVTSLTDALRTEKYEDLEVVNNLRASN